MREDNPWANMPAIDYETLRDEIYDPKEARGDRITARLKRRFKGISLDTAQAAELIRERIAEKRRDPMSTLYVDHDANPWAKETGSVKEQEYFQTKMEACRQIVNQEWRCTRSPFAYRLDSNFTNLPAQVRHILRAEGKPMVEIDIRSCQPALLYKIMVQRLDAGDPSVAHELERFKGFIQGKGYEGMAKDFEVDPKTIKVGFISWIMAPTGSVNYGTIDQYMQERFPIIREEIVRIKSMGPWTTDDGTQHAEHKLMARWLQREEVKLVIDTVCPQVLALRPKFPFFTVHDSLCVPEDRAQEVLDIVNSSLRMLGIPTEARIK